MSLRHTVRWAATDGLLLAGIRRRARAGNVDARIFSDPALQDDPFGLYDRMRAEHPFGPGAYPGALVTVHHGVTRRVLGGADFGMVASRRAALPAPARLALRLAGPAPAEGPLVPPSLLAVDAPEHTRFRRAVARSFTARAVAGLRDRTEQVATDLLDAVAADGACGFDLVERYAALLPVRVICEILGVPDDRIPDLLRWGAGVAAALDRGQGRASHRRAERDLVELRAWLTGHVAAIRRGGGAGLLADLVGTADDGGLTDHELLAVAVLVIAAGFETSVNAIAAGSALLMAHPEHRDLLRAEPQRWPDAVEEVLRYAAPVTRAARRSLRDTEVEGTAIPADTVVTVNVSAANRDPEVFADPARFDVTRPDAREHLSFSVGPHHCAGSALARMEVEVGLRVLFERFGRLRPTGPAVMRPTRIVRGYRSLPVSVG